MTHTNYEVSKRLKEFLGGNAPEPMLKHYYWKPYSGYKIFGPHTYNESEADREQVCPAYQLHDLLSKPFCEAMAKKIGYPTLSMNWSMRTKSSYLHTIWSNAYFKGGLPAVEKALMEMMKEAK